MDGWSAPDVYGVRTRSLDVGASVTLRGRRVRRRFDQSLAGIATWPAEWRELAREWLEGAENLRWTTWLKRAGPSRVASAHELLDALLTAGWIELNERRETGGRWVVQTIAIIDLERCREALGLKNREKLSADWALARCQALNLAELRQAASNLHNLAPALALRRHRWLLALDRWHAERRSGTRRDFAYFASGLTKGVPDSDWSWLADAVDLNALGIDPHTPLLLIRAPVRLMLKTGRLELQASPDYLAVTPSSVTMVESAEGAVEHYRVIENRTTFEHACRASALREAVIWVPGHPPRWWRETVSHLLGLCPAPAIVEADPDPSGIEIACAVGAIWSQHSLTWSTHNMDPTALNDLPSTQPLGDVDRAQLERLLSKPLPDELQQLALTMKHRGVKGEQEGLRTSAKR